MSDDDLVQSLRNHFSKGGHAIDWQGKSPVKLLGEAEKGVVLYREVLNQLTPANGAIEVNFERRLAENIVLVGKIDAVTTNATIVDHKTSRRSPTPWDVPLSLQPTVYALGLELEEGIRAAFGYIVFLAKGPRVELHTTERTKEDIAWLKDLLIPQVAEGILKKRFAPRPGWHCSTCHVRCDFCGYRSSWGDKIEAPELEV
jgi:CRISPR/Cas system-associated exonuclease Cas4 (RecB family)